MTEPAERPAAVGMGPILAIFVLSGAAGLVYEVVWARQLVLVFGNTTQAISTILTGFFGGMAIGSALGGRVADHVRRPLRLYGLLELVLVVVVLVTPVTFRLIHDVYRGAFGSLENTPVALALVRFVLALLALAPATILMGATLPTLTRYLTRGVHLSRAFGRLYAANTWGAVAGTVVSGLVLIELLGLTETLVVGAACSATAGLVALVLDRRAQPAVSTPSPVADDLSIASVRSAFSKPGPSVPAASDVPPANAVPTAIDVPGKDRTESLTSRPRLALIVAFVSGLTSLGYQTLWIRLLASGTGNSTYVFTLILAVFLVGLAIGAAVFSVIRPRIRRPVLFLALTQIGVAVLVIEGLVVVIGHPPSLPLRAEEIEPLLGALWQSVVLVVLPTTALLGIVFPASSTLLESTEGIGRRAGLLLACNTAGAIVGTFVIPFVVIPAIGSPEALILLASVNAGLGAVLALVAGVGERRFRTVAAASGFVVAALALASIVASASFLEDPSVVRIRDAGGTVYTTTEDEIASVQAGKARGAEQLWVTGTSMTLLTVDARLMPIMPLIARPQSTRALTIAFGMGSAFREAVRAGLTTDAVELVPSVPSMFGYFYPDAQAILSNPKAHVIIADGRNYVELTDKTYDFIVVDPPPPIESSGTAVLYSQEFYEASASRLTPGGVMMEWMPYGQTIEEFKAHVRTFHAVFPNVLIAYGPGGYGFFMLGSSAPISLDPAAIQSVLARPGVADDLSTAYDSRAHGAAEWAKLIPSLVWISGSEVDRFVGSGPLITDDRPLPEYFLLRRMFGPASPMVSPQTLSAALGQ